jgi:hypothetical protein
MPEATESLDNAAEAVRLRLAYKEALEDLGRPAQWGREAGKGGDIWRAKVFAQRNCEALLTLANMHATLAVADEIRELRKRYRMPTYGIGGRPLP